jgi:hypothetical protein
MVWMRRLAMEAQPPIYMLKDKDPLPLVDVARSVAEAEGHLTGHDQYGRSQGGNGVIGRPGNGYYDNLGNGLEPRRTPDNKIELVFTEQHIDVEQLLEIATLGFNALSAEVGAETAVMATGRSYRNRRLRELIQAWPSSRNLGNVLSPLNSGPYPEEISEELARRFLAPGLRSWGNPYKNGVFHNAWHIAKGICLNCPH